MRPICVSCQVEFRVKKNGVIVKIPVNRHHRADLWECPSCGHKIIKGFGQCYITDKDENPLVTLT